MHVSEPHIALRRKESANLGLKKQAGVMLLEALVALLIFSIGILGLVAIQTRAIALSQDAQYRAQASFLGNQGLAIAWSRPPNTLASSLVSGDPEYEQWINQVQATLPGATYSNSPTMTVENITAGGGAPVTVTIRWKLPASTETHQFVTRAVIGSQ